MLEERRFSSLYAVFYSAFSILSNQRGNVMHKRCRFSSLYGVFGIAALFAGSAITLLVMAFNLLGDAMRDVLDPRLRGR